MASVRRTEFPSSDTTAVRSHRLPVPDSSGFSKFSNSSTFAAASAGDRKPERSSYTGRKNALPSTGRKIVPSTVRDRVSVPSYIYATSSGNRKIIPTSIPSYVHRRSSTERRIVPSSYPDPVRVRSSGHARVNIPASGFTKLLKYTTFAPVKSSSSSSITPTIVPSTVHDRVSAPSYISARSSGDRKIVPTSVLSYARTISSMERTSARARSSHHNRVIIPASGFIELRTNTTSVPGSSSIGGRSVERSSTGRETVPSSVLDRVSVPSYVHKRSSADRKIIPTSVSSYVHTKSSTERMVVPSTVHDRVTIPASIDDRKIVPASVPSCTYARSSTEPKIGTPSPYPDPVPVRSSDRDRAHIPTTGTTFTPASVSTGRKIGPSFGVRGGWWIPVNDPRRRTTADAMAMVVGTPLVIGREQHGYGRKRVTKRRPAIMFAVPMMNTFPKHVLPTATEPTVGHHCMLTSYMIADKHGVMHHTDYKSWLKSKRQMEWTVVTQGAPNKYSPPEYYFPK